jgi:ATP-binding protein involved in chromosome partitioning
MSSRISPQDAVNALRTVKDPDTGRDIVTLGFIKELEVGDSRISFALQQTTPAGPARDHLVAQARAAVMALGVADVEVRVLAEPPARPQGNSLIPQVKYTVAVASGKGGVGKSTIAANLAVALHRSGAKVGLLDTDVYGPSVPILMGGNEAPHVVEGKIEPPVAYGIKIMSMAFFLPKDEAVIWRGPMLHKTIHQFLGDVHWGDLDYLIMDMPPGTGDIQLSLSQTIPLTGAVIVSTPQDLALTVASKAIAMFQKLNVPILGIIENMSYYLCPKCGSREEIFGHGGAREAAKRLNFAFLGEIPLDLSIRVQSDSGKPVALDDSTIYGIALQEVAEALMAQIKTGNLQAAEDISIE